MPKKIDIMVDLETLGTKPGSVILSIGVVAFDRITGKVLDEFHSILSQTDQAALGMTVDVNTLEWWSQQSEEAQKLLEEASQDTAPRANTVLHDLERFVNRATSGRELQAVWAQGQDFDFSLLAELYRRSFKFSGLSDELPWPFWLHRDTRTAYDVCGFQTNTIPREGVHHDALSDCYHQVKCLTAALAKRANQRARK